ncbi:MAG: efflux RND transporter periplasmic adaptor subunit [Ignavibacteriae bacterium]|nr:efflux RND transporter periplasmic adaptor subunit [Ignavibacteriota bacterium]
MSKKKKWVIIISFVLILILAAFVYYRVSENIKTSQKQNRPSQTVEIIKPERGDITSELSFSGDILAVQQTNIYSRVTGNIQRIYVDIGDYVTTGKLLALIDQSTFVQTVKQSEGLLNQAIASLENNKVNYQRLLILYEKGLTSKGDLDNAETLVKVTEAQVQTAEANYNNARLQLGYCSITAPFSGYITKRFLDQGSLVSSGTSNSIFILSNISKLKIMVSVLEKDIPLLENVKDVTVKTDAYPNEVFTAKFRKMSQSVDLSTRTMPVEVNLDNSDNMLKPGMFARLELILDKHNNVLIVPLQCVRKDDGGSFIYTVSEDNTAIKKYVQAGLQSNNKIEIESGLIDNDKVVSVGQELIKENSKVKISQ